jgi:putative colanic acid biosynthesis glycosyltransferase
LPPFFSIVTVTRNDRDGLRRTRESVVRQSYSDWEHIIVDGDSQDGTAEFLRSLGTVEGLRWLSEPDRGIYDAMNKGISLCQGRYILFMNAGDIFSTTETLTAVHCVLTKSPVDMLFCGANLRFRNGREYYRKPREISGYIWHGLPANHQAVYFKRSRLHCHSYDLSYEICGDYYLIASLYKQGSTVGYLDLPTVEFRTGDTSYRRRLPLFLEPYRIQRDVLNISFLYRLSSFGKRLISTLGMIGLQTFGLRLPRKAREWPA